MLFITFDIASFWNVTLGQYGRFSMAWCLFNPDKVQIRENAVRLQHLRSEETVMGKFLKGMDIPLP